MNREYISLREFCERTQISASTAYRMIRNGTLPAVKIHRNWRIPTSVFTDIEKHSRHFYLKKAENLYPLFSATT